jgi:hypothetical protein
VTGGPGSGDGEAVGIDPLTAPLIYPGAPPWRPAVLVTDTEVLTLQPVRDAPLGEWMVGPEPRPADQAGPASGPDRPLDFRLREEGRPPAADRTPVLAIGSNASPAQLRRKMANAGLPTQIPVTAVTVRGLTVGVSAHVSRPGYLPATPVPDPAAESQLWVLWLDAAALDAVDATEPNYHRVRLPARCPVRLTSGPPVTGGWVYRSRHGHLLNASGGPRRLTDQATLITALLTERPELQALAGTDPQQWIERTRDPGVRTAIREMFRAAGLVGSADRF